jgi:hypothetical protein
VLPLASIVTVWLGESGKTQVNQYWLNWASTAVSVTVGPDWMVTVHAGQDVRQASEANKLGQIGAVGNPP